MTDYMRNRVIDSPEYPMYPSFLSSSVLLTDPAVISAFFSVPGLHLYCLSYGSGILEMFPDI
jgi:hypothetical protein